MQEALVEFILFLHALRKLEEKPGVAIFGLAQDAGNPGGGKPDRSIDGRIDIADAGKRRPCLYFRESLELDRSPVCIEYHDFSLNRSLRSLCARYFRTYAADSLRRQGLLQGRPFARFTRTASFRP